MLLAHTRGSMFLMLRLASHCAAPHRVPLRHDPLTLRLSTTRELAGHLDLWKGFASLAPPKLPTYTFQETSR